MNVNQQQVKSATQEILRHIEDAATSKLAHFKISDRNQTLERKLQLVSAVSFAGIVVFWFVSTQLYSIIEAFGGSVGPAWRTTTQNAIPIGFAMANVIATTFLYLYRFGEKAHQHREAAQKYHRLWRKCLNYSTECPDISSADDLARLAVSYRQELSEINHSSPDIEEWAWKTVDSEIAKGGLEYDINKKADKSES
ncbi:MAG: SLATT domain-containing protein [Proteobacteria bacterium]|nr:SLATT domain-containing protein [Pseudomonadota bacterium]